MSEPSGFLINRPLPDTPGKYIVFVTRPASGMFATAGSAIFACDTLEVLEHHVEVQTSEGTVAFSRDMPFIMIPRVWTRPVSTKEMAEMQLAEKKEYDAVYEADEKLDAAELAAVKVTEDGRMKHDAQGYL